MARLYKGIEYTSTPYDEVIYHKTQTFGESSEGINSIQYRSESLEFNDSGVGQLSYTPSGSHYNFVRHALFDTGSIFDIHPYGNEFHKNKFYNSGSVIYIPQQYYGERINPKSFRLTDRFDTDNNDGIQILDDGFGNLYSENASFSQSANHLSSSENYVGNIHYETGIVVIAETGSWSGSVGGNDKVNDIVYSNVGRNNFNVRFEATKIIHSNQITLKINAGEFNASSNRTLFSASNAGYSTKILDTISGSISGFKPYASTIAFYKRKPGQNIALIPTADTEEEGLIASHYEEEAVMVARFPSPIQMRDDTDLTIIIKYDT